MSARHTPAAAGTIDLPAIGQPWPGIEGSLYAGIAPAEPDAGYPDDEHLVVLPGSMTLVLDNEGCIDWADAQGDSAHAPTQREGTLITATLRGRLDTSVAWWFWTSTKHGSAFAWSCHLYYGDVSYGYRSAEGGAVAVRRFPLHPFSPSEAAA